MSARSVCKRHLAVANLFVTSDVGTGQTTGAQQAHAFGAFFHGALNRLAHGAAEGNAALDLLRDAFGDELRIEVGWRISSTVTRMSR
jgi:hypothetical protein